MKQLEKLNLIYIASTGRSGSTLLDMLLGSHSQISTAGEIQILPHEILYNGFMPCGCGKPIPECSFWQEITNRINPLSQPEPQIHFFREVHNAGKTWRWKHLQEFSSQNLSAQKTNQIETYGRNNYQLFKAFLDLTEETSQVRPRWVVDASKDPYRLLWLVKSNLFNIKVLHLVKDPRAFVYSMTRRILHDRKLRLKVLDLTLKKSLSWSIHNYLISQIAKNFLGSSDYLVVNYEKLAAQPQNSIEDIFRFVGCQSESECVNSFRTSNIHTIAGNPMRYENSQIRLDEAWKESLPPSSKKIAELLTFINKTQYGY